MIVHENISKLNIVKPVVTIGIFDGVHAGHRLILDRLKAVAREIGGETVVITLWPHPRTVLSPDHKDLRLLNTLEEKIKYLAECGIDHLLILPFTLEFSQLSSCDFIEKYLINSLSVNYLVVGFNHHFGRDREGDIQKIRECSDNYHFQLEKLDARQIDGKEVSSSRIRQLIQTGKLPEANELLGYEYSITGKVVEGNQLGRKIGFPTANIVLAEEYKLIPQDGVYAVKVEINGSIQLGILNIGYRPTLSETKPSKSIEVHLIDYNGSLYNDTLTISFHQRLREEMKFNGLEELKKQLEKDRSDAINLFHKS